MHNLIHSLINVHLFLTLKRKKKKSLAIPDKVAIMAVKITIAVEKTAKDRDLEIGETLNITVVMKGDLLLFFFNFSSSLSNSPDTEQKKFLFKFATLLTLLFIYFILPLQHTTPTQIT